MMGMQQQWHGAEIAAQIEEIAWANLYRAALFLHAQLQRAVGVPYPPASKPGEPPHRRTGKGQRGIVLVPDRESGVIWIGATTGTQYMMGLDAGTARIKPRPWAEVTVKKFRAKLAALAAGRSA